MNTPEDGATAPLRDCAEDVSAGARPRRAPAERCATCGRRTALTFHHLIPRKLHRRKHFRRHYDRDVLNLGIHICRACHRGIHKRYDEMTLGRSFNTLAKLRQDPDLARHFAWVARQKY